MSEMANSSFKEEQTQEQKQDQPTDKDLLKARFRIFYQQATIGIIPVLIVLVVMIYLIHGSRSSIALTSWVTITLLSYIIRFRIRDAYQSASEQDKAERRWLRYNSLTVLMTGLAWGLGGVWFFPADHAQQVLVILIIGFLASGNSVTHAALPGLSQIFILSSLAPIIIYLFYLGGQVYIVAASILLLFMATLVVISFRSQKAIVNSVLERFSADSMVRHFQTISLETRKLNYALEREIDERVRVEGELRHSERELEMILENLPDTYYRTDLEGRLVKLSSSAQIILGYDIKELLGTRLADYYIDPKGREKFMEKLKESNGYVTNYEAPLRHKDGHGVWLSTSARYYYDDRGNIAGVEGVTRDISEKILYERKLFEEKERAQVTLAAINDVVISTDINGVVEYATPVLEEYLGWHEKEIIGKEIGQVLNIVDEESGKRLPDPVRLCLQKGERIDYKKSVVILHKDNKTTSSVEVTVAPIRNHEQQLIGTVVAIHDISELRGMARELTYQATHDPLTGLINRREFEGLIEAALEEARMTGITHALCYLDLDQFKVINDTCGHVAGDELLRQLAPMLKKGIRNGDIIARLGGDEFGILLHGCGSNKAVEIIEYLQKVITEFRFPWEDKVFDIGASIGLVTINESSDTLADILSAADSACYIAKEQGRNRIHVYESDETAVARHKGSMQWYNRINRALEEGRFELHFQPIERMNHTQGEMMVRGEFLLRMVAESGELISPGIFIPPAERYHLMPGIDGWVIREVLRVLSGVENSADPHHIYTVNISAQSLGEEYFLSFIHEQIKQSGIPPHKLCFEITETAAISNLTHAIDFMDDLKTLGCRFALDDFGSGVSSLANLKRLPVDFVKIDGEFVRGMRVDPADRAMVNSIVEISKVMDLRTIAEFVEDDATARTLEEIGVDYVQGYNIGRPQPVSDIFK